MITFDPIHLTGTFFNPKTRKMNHISAKQREECIEYVKQEMLLFDSDQQVQSSSNRKHVQLSRTTSSTYMSDFYINTENDENNDDDQQTSSKTSSHIIEIDLYLRHGADKTTTESNDDQVQECNSLSFWKGRHTSYPVLAKVTARVFSVPATSASVECEFSFSGNIITQKRSKLSPEIVNDIVFNRSYKIYKQKFRDKKICELIEL